MNAQSSLQIQANAEDLFRSVIEGEATEGMTADAMDVYLSKLASCCAQYVADRWVR